MQIREGTLEEMMALNAQIEEFLMPYGMEVLRNRLAGRNWLGLVAEDHPRSDLIGFKLGYELERGVFYSWLGGVLTPARGRGVARELLYEQERRLKSAGFNEVRVKSRNRYRGMVMLLLGEGYQVIGFEPGDTVLDNRIRFAKVLH